MRFTPQLRQLDWLVARPIAHRGLHDATRVENSESAFAAAIDHNYAIECDVQLTADGEAVVFHDDTVERVLDGVGAVRDFTTAQLKNMAFKQGNDRVQTLHELAEQTMGRATLVIELKSLWNHDLNLVTRAVAVMRNYSGPFAFMSFDPEMIEALAQQSPNTVRGITADRVVDAYYNALPLRQRLSMRYMLHMAQTKPHFISYYFRDLPFAPLTAFRSAGFPVITWTIKSPEDQADALRYCDQVTFQDYRA